MKNSPILLQFVVFGAVLVVVAGCHKPEEPVKGAWKEASPQGEAPVTGNPHGGAVNNPHGGNPHGGGLPMMPPQEDPHGSVDVTQLGLQEPDPTRPVDPNKFLSGTISPDKATMGRVTPGGAIFLSVKAMDPQTKKGVGAPLAVERFTAGNWPVSFHITEANAMIAGTNFQGDVVITAWFDKDGDAISKQSGDVVGEVQATIPAKNIPLVLNTIRP